MDVLAEKNQGFFGIPPQLQSPLEFSKACQKLRFVERRKTGFFSSMLLIYVFIFSDTKC
jgi:hypothetical protein